MRDPEPTLDEPDTDMEVIHKLRYEAGMYLSLYETAKARIEALETALREIERFDVHKKDVAAAMMQRIAHVAMVGWTSALEDT